MSVQVHPWVTRHGAEPLPPEDDNCCSLIEVTEEEVENSVKHIPSLATVVRTHTHTHTQNDAGAGQELQLMFTLNIRLKSTCWYCLAFGR